MRPSRHPHFSISESASVRDPTADQRGHRCVRSSALICAFGILSALAHMGCQKTRACSTEYSALGGANTNLGSMERSPELQALRLHDAFHFGPYPALPRTPSEACSLAYILPRIHHLDAIDLSQLNRDEESYLLGLTGIDGDIPDSWAYVPMAHFLTQVGFAEAQGDETVPRFGYVEVVHIVDASERRRQALHAALDLRDSATNGENDTTLVIRFYVDVACDLNYAILERRYRVDNGRVRAPEEYMRGRALSYAMVSCPHTSRSRYRFYRIWSRCG